MRIREGGLAWPGMWVQNGIAARRRPQAPIPGRLGERQRFSEAAIRCLGGERQVDEGFATAGVRNLNYPQLPLPQSQPASTQVRRRLGSARSRQARALPMFQID